VIKLPLRFDAGPLRADVERFREDEWVPHYNTALYEGEWSGIGLRSVGGKPQQLYPDPAAEGGFEDTEALARCPALAEIVAAFRCPLQAVRLLRLGPGASVGEHRDYRLGFEDGELRVHVPITTGPGVEFELDSRPVPMQPGEAWYVDVNRPHRVANRGDEPRVNLVLDCDVDDWLTALLEAGEPL
jgi:Aspartyl/Asparaginyl beta-hydroxylase